MKDRFLSVLSNERKFPEVGANSIVSSVTCGFHVNVKTSVRTRIRDSHALTHSRTLARES